MEHKAFCKPAPKPLDRAIEVIRVIAFALAGHQHVPAMVHVIVPLSGVMSRFAAFVALQPFRLVLFVFEDEVEVAIRQCLTNAFCYLDQYVVRAIIGNGVDRIKAQTIGVELFQPIEGVVQEKVAHRALFVEGKSAAPRGPMPLREEGFCKSVQVIAARAEMIIDNIDQNHHAEGMRAIYQTLQIIRRAVGCVRSEMRDAVIAPIAPTRAVGKRHQLDGGYANIAPMFELFSKRHKRPLRRRGSGMHFDDDRLCPRAATPLVILPFESTRVDHGTRFMHAIRLIT